MASCRVATLRLQCTGVKPDMQEVQGRRGLCTLLATVHVH
jgi:hypothetical protein